MTELPADFVGRPRGWARPRPLDDRVRKEVDDMTELPGDFLGWPRG